MILYEIWVDEEVRCLGRAGSFLGVRAAAELKDMQSLEEIHQCTLRKERLLGLQVVIDGFVINEKTIAVKRNHFELEVKILIFSEI